MALIFLVLIPVSLLLLWIWAEFKMKVAARVCIGLVAILWAFASLFFIGYTERFNSNVRFGMASNRLIEAIVGAIEKKQDKEVSIILNDLLDKHKQPHIDDDVVYEKLINSAVSEIKSISGR